MYQFTNTELQDIHAKVKTSQAEKAYLNFHGVKMYSDAARMHVYEKTGHFPRVTQSSGVASVVEVLKDDLQFPVTTSLLRQSHGWKVCEWTPNKQCHLSEILNQVPEKTFHNVADLETDLRQISRDE